jgi:hypothetical protein
MKKLVTFIVLLIVLAFGVSFVAADTNDLPGSGFESGQQIQNASTTDTANVVLTAYNTSGTSFACDSQTLAPGASFTWLPANCSTPAGFIGSAVASADAPIVAVVNVNNRTVGPAAGQYTGTDGSDVSNSIAFPLVKHNHVGRTTTFYVQNASGSANNITATFRRAGDAQAYVATFNNVPANAMVVVNPADATPAFPSGTGTGVGSLVVTGTGPLAGTSLEHQHTAAIAENMQASRRNFGPLNTTTGIQAQNVSGTDGLQISVTYNVIAPAPRTVGPIVKTADNGASANFLQSDDLNPGELASATVTASGNLAVIVNDRADAPSPQRFTTYACFAADNTTSTISLPLVKEDFFNNTTGVQVQNVGNAPATFTLTYQTHTNQTVVVTHTDAVAPGASKTFFRLAAGGTQNISVVSGNLSSLNSTVNGVVVTANQPIVAIANESNYTGAGVQDTKNYEGFNQ